MVKLVSDKVSVDYRLSLDSSDNLAERIPERKVKRKVVPARFRYEYRKQK